MCLVLVWLGWFEVVFIFRMCGLGGIRFFTGGIVFICGTCSIGVG